jgi:hypothetical protein
MQTMWWYFGMCGHVVRASYCQPAGKEPWIVCPTLPCQFKPCASLLRYNSTTRLCRPSPPFLIRGSTASTWCNLTLPVQSMCPSPEIQQHHSSLPSLPSVSYLGVPQLQPDVILPCQFNPRACLLRYNSTTRLRRPSPPFLTRGFHSFNLM